MKVQVITFIIYYPYPCILIVFICYYDSRGQLLFDIYVTCHQGGWVQAGTSIGKRVEQVTQASRVCIR